MNPRLLGRMEERKYSLTQGAMYVAIHKKTGKFLTQLGRRTKTAWRNISQIRILANKTGINLDDFFIYKISSIDKRPVSTFADWRYEPKIRRRNPMTENEFYDFQLLTMLTTNPDTYEVFIEDDKVYFKYKIKGKRNKENIDRSIRYDFKATGTELMTEMFHFLKINGDEITTDEI